ncbi:hypothetical protein IAU60_004918 [Kwoniella sp. DSM 27419]
MTMYDTAIVTCAINAATLDKVKGAFKTVYYHPDGQVSDEHAREADVWYTNWLGLPKHLTTLEQVPNTKVVQLSSVYMKLQIQFHLARTHGEWPARDAVVKAAGAAGKTFPGNRSLYGKTVGLLYCMEGTGDHDGSIPDEYFATSDPESFAKFLSQCDVLVASLPSTPQTTYMVTEKHLNDILAALDAEGGLWGAVLDVTDPEPLPAGHALFTHPSVIVTPHTSGSFENYFEAGAEVLVSQGERLARGESPINVVDPSKGY